MAGFKKSDREMPEMNTSSLPDLIFTILFFFMCVVSMREVTLQVKFTTPQGTTSMLVLPPTSFAPRWVAELVFR